jgi:hypothetical protein
MLLDVVKELMMTRCRVLLLVLILLLGLSSQADAASYPLIVHIPPTISIDTILSQLAQGTTLIDSIPGPGKTPCPVDGCTYLLSVPVVPLPAVASQLGIQWMELNKSVSLPRFGQRVLVRVGSTAASDWYKLQPAMQLINAGKASPFSTGRAIVVADINSQVDYAHPALIGHLTSGYDFVAGGPGLPAVLDQKDAGFLQSDATFLEQSDATFLEQSDATFLEQSNPAYLDGLNPAYNHGSLSAGIIAAIAPDSQIMSLRVFGDDGQSDLFTLAKAIRYAVDHGAHIVNLNFGILYPSVTIQSAAQFAQAANVLLVAPAGNSNTSQPQYPAAFHGVMTAIATDLSDTLASFSNYGSNAFVAAPGVDIISVYRGGYYSIASGTSLSAAAVAGTAALVRSLQMNGVSDSIARTAVNIDSRNPTHQSQIGHGRIDAFGAVMASLTPTATSISAPTLTYDANGLVTVTVASAAGTPTGIVTLTVDNAPPLSAPLNNGTAAFAIPSPKAGDHALSATYAAQGIFAASSVAGNLHVNKATPVISWNNPAPIEYATPLTATQLNARVYGPPSCVAGPLTYSPAAGTVLTLGPGPTPQNFYPWTLSATFAPADVANCNAPAVKTVTIIVQDTIPPVTSVTSQSPRPNVNGWNNTDVTVGLRALETPYIGSGVKNITVTLSGAMTGTAVVSGNTATVSLTTSGTTTITYFATDNVGNTETAKSLVVQVDKIPPEAFNQFDPATKTVKVLRRDSVSGVAINPIVGVCTPSTWGNDNKEEKDKDHPNNYKNTYVQLCTYTITDLAGNKLVLVEKVKNLSGGFDKGDGKGNTSDDSGKNGKDDKGNDDSRGRHNDVQIRIISTQYNGAATTNAPYNLERFEWTADKTGALRKLTQIVTVGNGKTRQVATAVFDARLNRTTITVKTPDQTGYQEGDDGDNGADPVVNGFVLLRFATNDGGFSIDY